jgi:putative inorganic carbon (hco3(-)) transporter
MKALLLTYALTYGGAACSLLEPWVGVLVYIAFSIIRPESLWFYAVPPGNYSRIVAIALLIGWGLRGLGSWRFGRATSIVWSFIGFVAWAAVRATDAPHQDAAWEYVTILVKILLPFLAGITMINSVARLKQLAWTIVIVQAYVSYELNVYYFRGYNMAMEGYGGMGRAVLGTGLVMALAMGFFLMATSGGLWQRYLAAACCLLIGHTVLLTYSRGALLATFTMAAYVVWLIPKTPKYMTRLALAVIAAAAMAGPSVYARFSTTFANEQDRDASAQGRIELWMNCLDLISKHPLVGIGPEHFGYYAPQYGWNEGKEAHNLWLQTGAELGLPGLFLLVAFYGMTIVRLWPLAAAFGRCDGSDDRWLAAFAAMTLAGVLGFAVAAVFVTVTRMETSYYAVLLGAGALRVAGSAPLQHFQTSTIEPENEWRTPCLS